MSINKDNYEAYFLDYYEGNLSPTEIEELIAFIEKHPEVQSEFEEFEMLTLAKEDRVVFNSKDSLKKNEIESFDCISADNIDEFLLAEIEGLLTIHQSEQLKEFIASNPGFEKNRRIFSHTRLQADPQIIYSQKQNLIHLAIPYGKIDETNYEDYLVGEIEGSLSETDKADLLQFMSLNPQMEHDHKLFGLTRLQPDCSIVFQNKSVLRHSAVPVRRIVLYTLSAAASIVLLFGLFSIFQNNNEPIRVANSFNINNQNSGNKNSTVTQKASNTNNSSPILASIQTNISSPKRKISLEKESSSQPNKEIILRNPEVIPTLASMNYRNVESFDFVEPEFMFIRTSQMHRNDYMELYYNVRLANQIQYAQLNEKDKNPERTILNSLAYKFTDFFNPKHKTEAERQPELSVWSFAELGVKTYNNISQDNVKLDLERDEKGKVIAYNLTGDKLDLQGNLRK